MISIGVLEKALKGIAPYLPIAARRLIPGILSLLPLVFELAALLYKHREEIGELTGHLTKQVSNEVKKDANGIAVFVSHLPKKTARKVRQGVAYFPVALAIAKVSYEKSSGNMGRLIEPFPRKVKKKMGKIIKRHHRRSRWKVFRRSS